MVTRRIMVAVPKIFFEEIKPFMKADDTKDAAYAGLISWGLQAYKDKGGFGDIQIPDKCKCEDRELYIADAVAEEIKKIFEKDIDKAYVKIIKLGIEAYKEAEKEDSKC